jgi:iron complex transport system substrate-binding protein
MYKKQKQLLSILLAILLLISFASCSNTSTSSQADQTTYPLSITDDLGNQVTIDAKPARIVSSSPAVTEILFALGLDEEIVGVSSSCDYPEAAKSKPQLFDYAAPDVESIIAAEPDVILSDVAYGIPEDTQLLLEQSDITIVLMTYTSIQDVLSNITLIGQITDKNTEAAALVEDINTQIAELTAKTQDQQSKSVFIDVGGFYSPGTDTYLNNMLTALGATNIAAEIGSGWVMVPVESLLEKDPDIYIDLSVNTSGDMPAESLVQNLSAIKNGTVYTYAYSSNETSILSRPGPRIVQAMQLLYDDIYGS